jgi:putative nucleotidyltransferase with HDIG domain
MAPQTPNTSLSELAVPIRAGGHTWGVLNLESREAGAFGAEDVLLADTIAAQVGSALQVSDLLQRLEHDFDDTLAVLSDALESKDAYTAEHTREVADMAERIGRRIGMRGRPLRALRYAALLHDIGKIGIRSEILSKPGPLTDQERAEMERHTVIGAKMLERISYLAPSLPLIRSAHERWDGAGYPDGLAGGQIPLGARVICACDAFHAMVSDRPYRAAMSREDALAELQRCAGAQFDAEVVDALVAELSDV